MKVTSSKIRAILSDYPNLTPDGFNHTKKPPRSEWAGETTSDKFAECVQRLVDWIQAELTPIKTTDLTSYSLKHYYEYAADEYVTDATFIIAWLILKWPHNIEPGQPSLNCGVSRKSLKALFKKIKAEKGINIIG